MDRNVHATEARALAEVFVPEVHIGPRREMHAAYRHEETKAPQ